MSKYKPLYSSIWNDKDFENYSTEKKLLFIFLITNNLVEKSGIYQISIKEMSFFTDINKSLINDFINDFINEGKIKYDFDNNIIFIKNVFKFQKGMIKNKKVVFATMLRNYQIIKSEFWEDFFDIYKDDETIKEFVSDALNRKIKDFLINNSKKKTTNKNPRKPKETQSVNQDIYQELAEGLKFVLEAKLNRSIKITNWNKDIRLLITEDLKPRSSAIDDVKRCIQAIADHYGKEYFPTTLSAGSFRKKFTSIENYLARNNKSNLSYTNLQNIDLEK